MNWSVKKTVLILVVALVTQSCEMYRLSELRTATQQGTPFQAELSKLYMNFAAQEEKEYDWADSWRFADKGLMLAYGKDAAPESLDDWNIPADILPDMERARGMLLSVLTPEKMNDSPSRTAQAQFYFDCWVEQQEENWQSDDIAYCRDNLMSLLQGLHAANQPAIMTSDTKSPLVTAPAKPVKSKVEKPSGLAKSTTTDAKPQAVVNAVEPKQSAIESISYAVFFENEKATLSVPGKNVVNEIVRTLKGTSDYEVIMRVNSSKSVLDTLSVERSAVVKNSLIDGGISDAMIRRSDAADSAPVAGITRRIEIFINE
jgi:outer membrane protein OmpA-like peptidoglycan-associated protein